MICFSHIQEKIGTVLNSFIDRYLILEINKKNIGQNCTLRKASISGQVVIGNNVKIVGGVKISGNITIGDYTSINGPNTDILSIINRINIGKFCSIARNVSIQEYNHAHLRLSSFSMLYNFEKGAMATDYTSKGPIEIGNDVWIGTHSILLSNIRIGNGAIVAANSLVNKDVPSFAIVGGVPAKIIGYRFSERIIHKIERLKWWDWDKYMIEKHMDLFSNDLDEKELDLILENL